MAISAFTKIDGHGEDPGAPTFVSSFSFTGDTAYPTGGYAFAAAVAAAYPGRTLLGIIPQACGGYVPEFVSSNGKLLVRQSAGSAAALSEVPNNTNLSAVTFTILAIFK